MKGDTSKTACCHDFCKRDLVLSFQCLFRVDESFLFEGQLSLRTMLMIYLNSSLEKNNI